MKNIYLVTNIKTPRLDTFEKNLSREKKLNNAYLKITSVKIFVTKQEFITCLNVI